jgi:hypothetical protein
MCVDLRRRYEYARFSRFKAKTVDSIGGILVVAAYAERDNTEPLRLGDEEEMKR